MKLCWLIPDDRGGGVASVALSCARQAHAAGHEVTLLLVLPFTGWLAGEEVRAGFALESLALEPPAADTPAALLRWLREHPQDVLVLNGCEQADTAIPYLPAGVRVVYAVHDTAPRYWRAAVRHEADLDAIVAVSRVTADGFQAQLREPGKLRVIHNGSFFPPLPPSVGGPGTADPRPDDLLFLCGDNPTKGAHDLLRLWPRLARDAAGFTGHLHWFGRMEAAFARRVRALPGAAGRIHLHGRAPRAEVFAAAARCRVFLMLSRVEPFGMTTIETMSMGAVPVAWDVATGTREIVRDGESGLFAPLGDFAALAGAVRRTLADHEQFGVAARRVAREQFSEEAMWAGYAALLAEVAARPPSARTLAGQEPAPYQPPRRRFQALPAPVRRAVRAVVGASPRLGYWLRDKRGL